MVDSLRRYHFFPKPRGRPKSDARAQKRAGSAGGSEPSIAVLKKYWLRAVEVRNPHSLGSDDGEDVEDEAAVDDEDDEQLQQEDLHNQQQQQYPWQTEQQRQRDERDRLQRWGLGDGAEREEVEAPFAFLSVRDRGQGTRRARPV
jgi:hypothetical protein